MASVQRFLGASGATRLAVLGGTALIFAVAAGLFASLQPRAYDSQMVLMVTGHTTDRTTAPQQALDISQVAQAQAQTYAHLVSSRPVTAAVVDQLGLTTTPQQLEQSIHATAPMGTNLIEVSVSGPTPRQARQIATAVALKFRQYVQRFEAGASSQPVMFVTTAVPPDLPQQAASPRIVTTSGLAAALGLALAGMAVLWASSRRETVRYHPVEVPT